MKNLLILVCLLFVCTTLYPSKAFAETFYHVGQRDTCNRVEVTVSENQVCPRLNASVCSAPPYRSQIDNYTFTITLRSLTGTAEQVTHQYSSHFCTNVCGVCADNSQYTDETVTVPATGTRTFVMSRTSPYGYACGNYQMDYGITAIGGNTACRYYGLTYPIGASAICEAGRACTGPTLPPSNAITGNVYIDANKNGTKDAGESNYSGAITLTSSRGTVTTNTNGTYSIANINPGAVTVSYTSLPTDYSLTYPLNGPPPSFGLTTGAGCNTNGANGASCAGGNISNLNFGITNLKPWTQSHCGSVRIDDGIDNPIPQSPSSGGYAITTNTIWCTNPGVAFSGDTTADFGSGQASTTQRVVGGGSYPEVYESANPSGITTSYSYLTAKAQQAGITPTNLATVCTLNNCTLPSSLPHGIYQANDNVTLNTYQFPINQDYVILINGNLTIRGNISTPLGSTAVFSTAGNIIVDAAVGWNAGFLFPNLDGIFSTDRSFIVNSTNTCNDLTLSIGGNIVTNASGSGGSFQNNRDLCGNDANYPTIYFYPRPDFFLNLPDFMRVQNTLSWEDAP